ncbi:hypothetical protein NDU88_005164 [Pleurodeles waltl]|uniref:Uncharacterized protein n=1 Tax=Pleurodeles waltl TaxID=8319 RepID=A0AAV7VJ61_PLEWA|nr:hypothetical protein NDU88_005164 [Pleurodeles waltl]
MTARSKIRSSMHGSRPNAVQRGSRDVPVVRLEEWKTRAAAKWVSVCCRGVLLVAGQDSVARVAVWKRKARRRKHSFLHSTFTCLFPRVQAAARDPGHGTHRRDSQELLSRLFHTHAYNKSRGGSKAPQEPHPEI